MCAPAGTEMISVMPSSSPTRMAAAVDSVTTSCAAAGDAVIRLATRAKTQRDDDMLIIP